MTHRRQKKQNISTKLNKAKATLALLTKLERKTQKYKSKKNSLTPSARAYLSQLLHPFETNVLTRGPFSGQPTGIYKQYVRGTITVPTSGFAGVIATPYPLAAALSWTPTSIAGTIAPADFALVPYAAQGSVAATYYGLRPLAGGLRVTATGTPNTVAGTMYLGNFTPGQSVLGVNYSAITSSQLFRSQHAFTPGEVIFPIDMGISVMGAEYRLLSASAVSNVLGDYLYAFPAIFIAGASVSQTFTYEATFIMEGISNGTATGFTSLENSDLTIDQWQRACMTEPKVLGSRLARSGSNAVTDGIPEVIIPTANTGFGQEMMSSMIPPMAAAGAAVATTAAHYFRSTRPNGAPNLPY